MQIQRYCVLRYWIAQLLWPLCVLLLCLPLLGLATWQQQRLHQQRQTLRSMQRPMHKQLMQPQQSTAFLLAQLQLIQAVFHSGLRVLQLSWQKHVLQVEAESVSSAVFFSHWRQWKQKNTGVQLLHYGWHGGLQIKAQVRDAMAQ